MPLPWKNSGVAPVGATPRASRAITLCVLGFQSRTWVSPPQLRVSHMVQAAASMAAVASTAFPPFWYIIAPAVAARGLPVMASQWRAWRTGLLVRAEAGWTPRVRRATRTAELRARDRDVMQF